ncbi:MAG: hypothetical protein WCR65_03765, partial [Parcubacteria group bacterium]
METQKNTKISKIKRGIIFLFGMFLFFVLFANNSYASEWRYEGISYYVPEQSTGNSPVYRFYSPLFRAHFFTISATEKNRIIATYPSDEWRYEGIAYYVPTTSAGNDPVYRFYSPRFKTHFFTTSATEKNR